MGYVSKIANVPRLFFKQLWPDIPVEKSPVSSAEVTEMEGKNASVKKEPVHAEETSSGHANVHPMCFTPLGQM